MGTLERFSSDMTTSQFVLAECSICKLTVALRPSDLHPPRLANSPVGSEGYQSTMKVVVTITDS